MWVYWSSSLLDTIWNGGRSYAFCVNWPSSLVVNEIQITSPSPFLEFLARHYLQVGWLWSLFQPLLSDKETGLRFKHNLLSMCHQKPNYLPPHNYNRTIFFPEAKRNRMSQWHLSELCVDEKGKRTWTYQKRMLEQAAKSTMLFFSLYELWPSPYYNVQKSPKFLIAWPLVSKGNVHTLSAPRAWLVTIAMCEKVHF